MCPAKIDGQAILFGSFLVSRKKSYALLAKHLNRFLNLSIADRKYRLFKNSIGQVCEFNVRIHLKSCTERNLAGLGRVKWLNFRSACYTKLLLTYYVAELHLNRFGEGFRASLGSKLLLNQLHRNLARTETRHLYGACHLDESSGNIPFNVGGNNRHIDCPLE